MFFSCQDEIEIINRSVNVDTPTITVVDFTTSYSDSALLQMKMEAPLMEYYGKKEEPYSEFPEGIIVWFYDGKNEPTGHISARFGKYYEDKGLWEVSDSVVAINENNETLQTELLFWEEANDLIYTDKYVRITTEDQIARGYGLEADTRFSNWIIKREFKSTIYIDDE